MSNTNSVQVTKKKGLDAGRCAWYVDGLSNNHSTSLCRGGTRLLGLVAQNLQPPEDVYECHAIARAATCGRRRSRHVDGAASQLGARRLAAQGRRLAEQRHKRANRHLDGLDLGILVAGPRTAARRSSRATLAAAADAAKQAAADVIIDCERKARASRAEIGGEDGARVVQAGAARVAARAGRRRSIR